MPNILNVNPTRMEMYKLKTRLKTAVRGHKLLKDKSDEMVRQFILHAKENKALREKVESRLDDVVKDFLLAKSISDENVVDEVLALPMKNFNIELSKKNIMSVYAPELNIKETKQESLFPYSFATITSELDNVILKITELADDMIKLAEIEKTCNVLANEIEKNRRRVNALEYVMIPQIEETIKYISMKLDENERGNVVRLMKVKTMLDNR